MIESNSYIARDPGAESGRVILGTLTADQLTIEKVHRFPNGAAKINGSIRWDILGIFYELKDRPKGSWPARGEAGQPERRFLGRRLCSVQPRIADAVAAL